MLANIDISELIKLRQDEEEYDSTDAADAGDEGDEGDSGDSEEPCTYALCNLFEAFDWQEAPEDLGAEDDNKTMGMIGLILTSLGLSAGVGGGFLGGSWGWYSYVAWGLAGVAYFADFYGWWMWIQSVQDDASAWDAFSSWRWNMLAVIVAAVATLFNVLTGFLWYFSWPTVWGSSLGALVLVAVGGYFVAEYVQGYWWNLDESGDMASNADWDWFAEEGDNGSTTTVTTTTVTEETTYYYY